MLTKTLNDIHMCTGSSPRVNHIAHSDGQDTSHDQEILPPVIAIYGEPTEGQESLTSQSTSTSPSHERRVCSQDTITTLPVKNVNNPGKFTDQFFNDIKRDCECDNSDTMGPDPHMLASHRQHEWPEPTGMPKDLASIYTKVKQSGIPNALGVQIYLPTELKLEEWVNVFGKNEKYSELLQFVRYGFPMGYMGPSSNCDDDYNHSSAVQYPEHPCLYVFHHIDNLFL